MFIVFFISIQDKKFFETRFEGRIEPPKPTPDRTGIVSLHLCLNLFQLCIVARQHIIRTFEAHGTVFDEAGSGRLRSAVTNGNLSHYE